MMTSKLPHSLLLGSALALLASYTTLKQPPAQLPPSRPAAIETTGSISAKSVIIQGSVFSARDTTGLAGLELVFSGRQNDNTLLSFRTSTRADGAYRVAVLSGRTYQVAINSGGKSIETQEFAVPESTADSLIIKKNFYVSYVDTVASAGPGDVTAIPGAKDPRAMPNLDWPLPPPSARWTLPDNFLAGVRTCGQADKRLTKILEPAGYNSFAYYAIPGAGDKASFALVTQLEQIDDEARPKPPRWSNALTPKGAWQRLLEPFIANKGRFRVLVFAFTSTPVTFNTKAKLTQHQAESMLDAGASSLDAYFGKLPCPSNCRVTVLVYEYTKADTAIPPLFVKPSSFSASDHLARANVKVPH